eukprot:TRINITY_DN10867_c0_g1_i1.p1 TRINITY_DN10867_c0_g1~~TRINITY_DN10867_c0_g1_i1.p1  ORF type:complete len:302 (-),score=11.78 TRINITY_DN10867_c0_g1_i1:223-1128(-)
MFTRGVFFVVFIFVLVYLLSQLFILNNLNTVTSFINIGYTSFKPVSMAANMATGHIRKIPSDTLHKSTPVWWLESRFHFSFADYFNPSNMNFGALRVLNDDLVKPHAGFGTHGHRDAEIFSYIVYGELSHADSMGNKEALPRGCVQYLSAGKGITHSELNDGNQICRFLQIWLTPDRTGHTPQYGSTRYSLEDRHNKLLHIIGGTGKTPAWNNINSTQSIKLHQDANVFVSECDGGFQHKIDLGAKRQAYMVCIEGDVEVNGNKLNTRDAMEIVAEDNGDFPLTITAGQDGTHFMIIEMHS